MNVVAFRTATPEQSHRPVDVGSGDLHGSIREAVKGLCTARLIQLCSDLGSVGAMARNPVAADVLRRARCIADADRILATLKAS